MTKTKRAARHIWTAEEEVLLRRDYADTPTSVLAARLGVTINQIYRKKEILGLKKSARYRRSSHSGRFRRGERRGQANEFKPGMAPHNKGKTFNAGGRSAETRFKAGHLPHNAAPVGMVTVDERGYLKKKVANNGNRHDRQFLHRLIWEAAHGPAPTGYVVVFKDGDKRNVALDNLECVSRAENMRRNTILRYPPELRRTIRAAAKLRRAIEEKPQ